MSINKGKRLGPIQPSIELRSRPDSFRLDYIATRSFGHGSTSGNEMQNVLVGIRSDIEILQRRIRPVDLTAPYNSAVLAIQFTYPALEAEAKILWELHKSPIDIHREPQSEVLIGGLAAELDFMDRYFDPKNETSKVLEAAISRIPEEKKENTILLFNGMRQNITWASDFCADRAAFMHGENVESGGAAASFFEIKAALAEKHGDNLVIEDGFLNEGTRVAMSKVRLFSLLNNLLADGMNNRAEGTKVELMVKTGDDNGFMFYVRNTGSGIPAKYFEPAGENLIRLFQLEERMDEKGDKRIAIGLCEVNDIIAISNGWSAVESVLDGVTEFGGWLPAEQVT
ncbi:MAG: ATP-binding protein [Candidatus Margulisiibacteriota bacterium]